MRDTKFKVGDTPLVEIKKLAAKNGVAPFFAKVELFNPSGSVKDRIALSMIEDFETKRVLKPGATIIEPTSGNTGIGLALVGRMKGYKVLLTMPESMTIQRREILKEYGALLALTPAMEGMSGAVAEAKRLNESIEGSVIMSQFDNPANPMAHLTGTGPEIWEQTKGDIDVFVAGVGTGGTISGVGSFLKKQNSSIKIIAVEPASSPLLSKGWSGAHAIQGLGANFKPANFNPEVVDEIVTVENSDAIRVSEELMSYENLFVGYSSGAVVHAVIQLLKRDDFKDLKVVTLLPDSGNRYH
ncbi:MAG TPA: cysteine synthase A [Bacteroidaceae bacterium]|nr:cysteine synthase A [Bacteroidaceae bacterium]